MPNPNLRAQLATLPAAAHTLLTRCAAAAREQGTTPYLVGGAVRDFLLGRPTLDLDLVVVGDALAVARTAQAQLGGDLTLHEAFGTATLALPDGLAIDLITARRETYPFPGALPLVIPATLDEDLRRRDFAINALAVALAPHEFGTLIDPLDGRSDLAAGHIRILHDASFRDDPTRLLRAIRYAARFSADGPRHFDLPPETAAHFAAAVATGALHTVSAQRSAHEFVRLLAEPAAAAMVARLAAAALLAQIEPRLRWDDATSPPAFAALDRWWPLAERPTDRWQGRFALLAAQQAAEVAAETATALHLPTAAVELVASAATLRQRATTLPAGLTNVELGQHLDPFNSATIATTAALLPPGPLSDRLIHHLAAIRPLKPTLTGDAIRALGIPPGPIYREALAALRDHKRAHPTLTTTAEHTFLRAWLHARGLLSATT